MKVQKYEISRTIDKLKSIVQKNDQFPALGGVLVKDGYLIASNTEMTMQLKLEASKGSCFIIPMKAFDVIKNLPDGEVIIDADGKNIVTIKTIRIQTSKHEYGKLSDYLFILHCRCPPVRRGKWLPAAAR